MVLEKKLIRTSKSKYTAVVPLQYCKRDHKKFSRSLARMTGLRNLSFFLVRKPTFPHLHSFFDCTPAPRITLLSASFPSSITPCASSLHTGLSLKCIHTNCTCVHSEHSGLAQLIQGEKPQIVALTEMWLRRRHPPLQDLFPLIFSVQVWLATWSARLGWCRRFTHSNSDPYHDNHRFSSNQSYGHPVIISKDSLLWLPFTREHISLTIKKQWGWPFCSLEHFIRSSMVSLSPICCYCETPALQASNGKKPSS